MKTTTTEIGAETCAEQVCYVRDLLERVAALEAGLQSYGTHKPRCYAAPLGFDGGPPCSCGLAALAGES